MEVKHLCVNTWVAMCAARLWALTPLLFCAGPLCCANELIPKYLRHTYVARVLILLGVPVLLSRFVHMYVWRELCLLKRVGRMLMYLILSLWVQV